MFVCVVFKVIAASRKWINSAVNSTQLKIFWKISKKMCVQKWERECVSKMKKECVLVWLVFSKPFEALNELIPSRYIKSPTSILSHPQHDTVQCNSSSPLSSSTLVHAFLLLQLTHKYALSLLVILPVMFLPRVTPDIYCISFGVVQ